MAVTLVGGARSVGGATTGTSFVTTNPQSPTANNMQTLVICSTRTTAAITLSGLSGWTLMGSASGSRSSVFTQVWLYARVCAGADGAPTIGTSGSTRLRWMIEEWSGLSTTLPTTGIPETWTIANAGSPTTVSHTETAEVDNEWVFAVLGGRASSGGVVTFTWDSDLTADQNTATGSNSYFYTATGEIATAGNDLVASFDVTNAQGDGMNTLGMVGFAPAGTNGTVNAVTATATGAAGTPSVSTSATVAAAVATATALALAPVVSTSATVSPPTATATAAAHAPTVTTTQNPTVAGVAATATGTAGTPVVDATQNPTVAATTATATAAGIAPVVTATRSATVTGVAATATGTAPAPVVTAGGSATVNGTTATATAAAHAPTVSGTQTATVQALAATATALALPPVVTGIVNATVAAVPATATALAPAPFVAGVAAVIPEHVRTTITSPDTTATITSIDAKAVIT